MDAWAIRIVTAALHFGAGLALLRASVLLLEVDALASEIGYEQERQHPTRPTQLEQQKQPERTPADPHGVTEADTATAVATQESVDTPPTSTLSLHSSLASTSQSRVLGCCLSTLLYVVHPMHVEVVAWPSAQPYALAALFAHLSLVFYLQKMKAALQSTRSKQCVKGGNYDRISSSRFDANHLAALGALGTFADRVAWSSVCVLLPTSFLLLDALVFYETQPPPATANAQSLARGIARCAAQKIGFFAALLASGAIALWSNEYGAKVDTDALSLTPTERLLKCLATPAWTARQLLWPARLRVHFQLRDGDLDLFRNLELLLSIMALAVCGAVGMWRLQQRQSPHLLLALLYFCAMLLPVSGLVQHGIVTQGCARYAYFPSTVLVPFGGRALARLCFAASSATGARYRVFAAYLAVLCALVRIATLQMETWRDEKTLYAHSLRCVSASAHVRASFLPETLL
ncbi:hypothetical protein PybrP1_006641 [[Pythium] brassicae (nom. inval.)]|nr:hypothetical protein PybrP1_006641 [[Pythium] brassicae (nom. inval.)]